MNGSYNDDFLERQLKLVLWGYPKLYEEFTQNLRPVLALIREEDETERARPRAEDEHSLERIGNPSRLQSKSENRNDHASGSKSPAMRVVKQSVPDVGSVAGETGQVGAEPKIRIQSDDHVSLPGEHPPSTATKRGPDPVDLTPSSASREHDITGTQDDVRLGEEGRQAIACCDKS